MGICIKSYIKHGIQQQKTNILLKVTENIELNSNKFEKLSIEKENFEEKFVNFDACLTDLREFKCKCLEEIETFKNRKNNP